MKNVKVVLFPGAPVVVRVEGTETVAQVFDMANMDASGRELKIDGRMVDMDDEIGDANMLIAMKKIKGNAELKVVNFPGAPITIQVNGSMTVKRAFDEANIDCEGRELKLDGRMVQLDDWVDGGRMLIAMKKIKGNTGFNIGDLIFTENEDYLVEIYDSSAPTIGHITDMEEDMIAVDDYYMDREFVEANFKLDVTEEERVASEEVYEEVYEESFVPEEVAEVEEHVCECDCVKTRAEEKLAELNERAQQVQDMIDIYLAERVKIQEKIDLVESILINPVG